MKHATRTKVKNSRSCSANYGFKQVHAQWTTREAGVTWINVDFDKAKMKDDQDRHHHHKIFIRISITNIKYLLRAILT